jgi:DNA-binding MarR family transcriptional regulator
MLLLQHLVTQGSFMENIKEMLESYVLETFGEQTCVSIDKNGADRFPIFIGQAYDMGKMNFLDRTFDLFFPKATRPKPTPADVTAHIKFIRKICGTNFVFVFADLLAYERKRYIQERVPFIIPRRQTYLPQFYLDLREQANAAKNRLLFSEKDQPLSGPAQVLLLYYLQHPEPVAGWALKQWAKTLGYSTMTATRICDELTRCGLGRSEISGKRVILLFEKDRKALWDRALPYLRNPIIRRTFSTKAPKDECCLAGVSALATYTMIAEDRNPVYAMSASEYRRAVLAHTIAEQNYCDTDSIVIEQWRYRPNLLTPDQTVDRLSLYLSLKDNPDERIEAVLKRLIKEYTW